jgi:hypothetical protein
MTQNTARSTLRLDEGGLWIVRSSSATVCHLDLDSWRLRRDRGEGSPSFAYDGVWVPLVLVESSKGDTGVIRVGDRHRFLTDPGGGVHDYQWWIPRTCIAIEPVAREDPPEFTAAPGAE